MPDNPVISEDDLLQTLFPSTPAPTAPVLTDLARTREEERANAPRQTPTKLPYLTYEQVAQGSDDTYDPSDFRVVGERMRANILKAVAARFPLKEGDYTLSVENLHYDEPKDTSLKDEKRLMTSGGTLADRLRGDWVLTNKDGQEVQRKTATMMSVPRMTRRGLFIRKGANYGLKHMFRLRPGIYARVRGNGIIAAHINPEQGSGRQMSLELEPTSGALEIHRGTRKFGLLPILKAAGVEDEAIKEAWGEELYDMNRKKYARLLNNDKGQMDEYADLWKRDIEPVILDPDTTETTLGKAYAKMEPGALMDASRKILNIARTGDDDELDDRDGLQFQRVLGPADYIAERVVRDGGGVLRKAFLQAIRKGNLDDFEPGVFQPHVDSVFLEDRHAYYPDEASPFESLDSALSISRLGEGGIGSTRAAPEESRGVQDSYPGYIDPVRTSESTAVGLNSYLSYGVRKDDKGNLYSQMRLPTGEVSYVGMDTAAKGIVATPEYFKQDADPEEIIPAFYKGKGIEYVPRKDVDFYIANTNNMMSIGSGTIPLIGGIRSNRTMLGCVDPATLIVAYIGNQRVIKNARWFLNNPADLVVGVDRNGRHITKRLRGARKTAINSGLYQVTLETKSTVTVSGNHKWAVAFGDMKYTSDLSTLPVVITTDLDIEDMYIPVVSAKLTGSQKIRYARIESVQEVPKSKHPEYLVDIDMDDDVYLLANGVFTHNSKYPLQALSIEGREAPLVRRQLTTPDGVETTTEAVIGGHLGAMRSPVEGTVVSIDADEMKVRDLTGKLHTIDLYNNHPTNQKGFIHNTPTVKVGDTVGENQLVASSNYTDSEGVAALGTNLRVAFLTGPNASTFEDGIAVSEEAARTKLASTRMYAMRGAKTPDIDYDKNRFLSLFPLREISKEQLDTIGADGIIKPGTVVNQGDPIYLGVQTREKTVAGVPRKSAVPYIERWEHDYPGEVVDVIDGKKHHTAYIRAKTPLEVGDKLCFDSETEVLTDSGWKHFDDVTVYDRILTLDKSSGNVFMTEPVGHHRYRHTGKMYSLVTKDLDICVTDNHRHLVSRTCDGSYMTLLTSKEIWRKNVYHLTGLDMTRETSYKSSKVKGAKERWIDYDGYVHCLEVPYTHTLYVRRNGKAVWSGNSNRYGAKGVACYDDETSVFTKDKGFVLFKDLTTDDEVAVYDPVTGTAHFEKPSAIHAGPYTGTMYGYKGKGLDWLVTPTHDMFAVEYYEKIYDANTYRRVNVQSVEDNCYVHLTNAPFTGGCMQTASDTLRQDYNNAVCTLRGGLSETILPVDRAKELQRLLLLQGYGCVLNDADSEFVEVRVTDQPRVSCRCDAHGDGFYYRTQYNAMVYCCTVSTGIILVERDGKPLWCGNSIIPTEEMPIMADGSRAEVLQSPLGLVSRINTSQLVDAQAGKVAYKNGQPIALPDFMPEDDLLEWSHNLLKENGLEESEDLYDPVSGKTIPDIDTGNVFYYIVKHQADSKAGSRSTGAYTSEGVPMKGGKEGSRRIGGLELGALLGGGGEELMRDAKIVRGQRNDDFWRAYRNGEVPKQPGTPFVHEKFFNHLKAAGVSIEDTPDTSHIYLASSKDIDNLTGGRQVTAGATFDAKRLRPVDGGLFDPSIFGPEGTAWGYYELPEPVLSPLAFKPVANLLGWKDKELQGVLDGEREINGKVGIDALQEALSGYDVDKNIREARMILKAPKTTLAKRDAAIKKLRALIPMREEGKMPEDFLLTKMPILPPAYRPVTPMSEGVNLSADINFLYKRMMDTADDLKEAKAKLPSYALLDVRKELNNAVQAVVGTATTNDPKLQSKNVGGLLEWVFGKNSPKMSAVHRKVFGASVDLGGRGVITPDNSLSIDEIGIPEPEAWRIYEPRVVRGLRSQGFELLDAVRLTADKSPEARRELLAAMKNIPILFNRAPTLWEYGILGAKPKLVSGKAIHLNPNVTKVLNADHDGDAGALHTPITQQAVDKVLTRMLPSRRTLSPADNKAHFIPFGEFTQGLTLATGPSVGKQVEVEDEDELIALLNEGVLKINTPVRIRKAR